MKKIALCLMVIASAHCAHGMEVGQSSSAHKTIVRKATLAISPKIVVVYDNLDNRRTKKADITVVGMPYYAGDIADRVMAKGKDATSPGITKKLNSMVLTVVEPELITRQMGYINCKPDVGYRYEVGYQYTVKTPRISWSYYEDEAVEEIEKDLGRSYRNVLERAHFSFTKQHTDKSIALPLLGKGVPKDKAMKVAIASIIQFAKNSANKDQYNSIEFVLSGLNDFIDCLEQIEKEFNIPVSRYKKELFFDEELGEK